MYKMCKIICRHRVHSWGVQQLWPSLWSIFGIFEHKGQLARLGLPNQARFKNMFMFQGKKLKDWTFKFKRDPRNKKTKSQLQARFKNDRRTNFCYKGKQTIPLELKSGSICIFSYKSRIRQDHSC